MAKMLRKAQKRLDDRQAGYQKLISGKKGSQGYTKPGSMKGRK
jgi:hypothetical protein